MAATVAASILGTLISPLERAQELVFYAWWYQALLLLLALSMAGSTWRTVRRLLRGSAKGAIRADAGFYENAASAAALQFSGDLAGVERAFRESGFSVVTQGNAGYAWKGRWGRWGAAVSHVGIVVVLLAGLASRWVAQQGFVQLAEGEETREMAKVAGDAITTAPLGFALRCDDFEMETFPRSRIPAKFVSALTVTTAGGMPRTERVEVNRSMSVGGWRFHQSGYEASHTTDRYLLSVSRDDLPGTVSLEVSAGQTRHLPLRASLSLSESGNPPEWRIEQQGRVAARGVLTVPQELPSKSDQEML